ncbi:MAG TPA: T9SS type A sorting domain-containing protein [Ignavibacteriaceae bacterium]|nr:T9SS type A sorting domain-containing protein [Ignavibacteriaceae bacterium]
MLNGKNNGYPEVTFRILLTGLILLMLVLDVSAQTADQNPRVYDVQPGTKNNKINLTVANISETNSLGNIKIKPVDFPEDMIKFKTSSRVIKQIDAKQETEVVFEFDINRNAPVNVKDTLKFSITGSNNISAQKEIILNFIAPKEYRLEQNYPNPFNPATKIQYQLPFNSKVTLKIYDILGEEVQTLVNEVQDSGYKEVSFNGSNYASGIYIYRLTAQNKGNTFTSVKKMVMVK